MFIKSLIVLFFKCFDESPVNTAVSFVADALLLLLRYITEALSSMQFMCLLVFIFKLINLPKTSGLVIMHATAYANVFLFLSLYVALSILIGIVSILAFQQLLKVGLVELLGCLFENLFH
jgi:hypothetical protein